MFIYRRYPRLAVACCCLALLMLTACAPGSAPMPVPSASTDLVVAAPAGELSRALETAAAVYARQGGVAVRVEALNSNEYYRKVSAALLAGLDTYDMVYLSAEDLAAWAGYHAIQPLSGEVDTTPLAPWLPAVTVAGKLYGLPTQPDPVGLWYRADLLRDPAIDWETLTQTALLRHPGPVEYGMITAGTDAGIDFIAVLASFGGEMVSPQYQAEIDRPAALLALKTYIALSPPGAQRFTRTDVLDALADGRAAMGIGPYSASARLLDCAASPKVCRAGQPLLAWARLPGIPADQAVGSLGAWAIPLHAARAEQAQRFLSWLGGEAGAQAWAQAGGIPAHRGVLAALDANDPLSQVVVFRTAFPPVSTADLLWKATSGAVQAAVSAGQAPQQALAAAAEKVRGALRQAGYTQEE